MRAAECAADVLSQIVAAGCTSHLIVYELHEATDEKGPWMHGFFTLAVLDVLKADKRFLSGGLHLLHPEVPRPRCEYRSITGTLGPGSLQIVINTATGCFSADVDCFNIYQDVVNIGGHTFIEVLPHFVQRWFRKRDKDHA